VDSGWRRLNREERTVCKREFASVTEAYARDHIVRSYSLVGTRGDVDFMLWTISEKLEDFQELLASLLSTTIGRYLEVPYSYLAMTRRSEYLGSHRHEGQDGAAVKITPYDSKYLFIYPFTKKREWYSLPHEERKRMMQEHFRIGHKFPSVRIHTAYSFGLDDQEFVLGFETDSPSDFSELVMELRGSEASRFTAVETPVFTCIAMGVREILDMLAP
jgi:chlorite dismutase